MIKQTKLSLCIRLLSTLFVVLNVYIILVNIIHIGQVNSEIVRTLILIFLVATVIAIIYIPKTFIMRIVNYIKNYKWIQISAIVLLFACGFILRFWFLQFEFVAVFDPFIENATSLFQSGEFYHAYYIGMFPFYYSYIVLLTAMFKIMGSGLLAIILLNTFFDLIASCLMGWLIYQLKQSPKWAYLSACLWWICPVNIAFCVLALPIIIVNAAILLILIISYNMYRKINILWRTIGLSALLALSLAFLDAFRPISIIAVIAIVLYHVLLLIRTGKFKLVLNSLISIAIILMLSRVIGYGWQQVVNNSTGLPTNEYKSGWNIYVGANYDSHGRYNEDDDGYLGKLITEFDRDYSEVFRRLQKEGIERYMELELENIAILLINKSFQLAGDNVNMVDSLAAYYPSLNGILYDLIRVSGGICWFIILSLSLYFIYKRRKYELPDFIIFINILIFGYFFSFLLVEVRSRYFVVLLPMFFILAMLGLMKSLRPEYNQGFEVGGKDG